MNYTFLLKNTCIFVLHLAMKSQIEKNQPKIEPERTQNFFIAGRFHTGTSLAKQILITHNCHSVHPI
jgi:hypothetical protein